jgi:hypothetical protein
VAYDVASRSGPHSTHAPPPASAWQFIVRAILIVTGLTLLIIVDVHGVAFYLAWALIGLALLSEAAATLVYWRRTRGRG